MKFLWVSKYGDGLALALRLKEEGNDVVAWIQDESHRHMYDGLLTKVDHFNQKLEKDRIIIYDMVGAGAMADRLRVDGYKVFGATKVADLIELDRLAGLRLMQKVRIKTPRS